LTNFTSEQLAEIILQGLRDTAQDVDGRRVPLDGRVRLLTRKIEDDQPRPGTPAPASAK
jgi:hypothetical protein